MFIRKPIPKFVFNEVVFYRYDDRTSPTDGNIRDLEKVCCRTFYNNQNDEGKMPLSEFMEKVYAVYGLDVKNSKVYTKIKEDDYVSAVDPYDEDMEWSDGDIHYFFISVFTMEREVKDIIDAMLDDIKELNRISYEFSSVSEFDGADIYINSDKQSRFFSRTRAIVVYNDTHVFYEETTNENGLGFHLLNIIKQFGSKDDYAWATEMQDKLGNESNIQLIEYIHNKMTGIYRSNNCQLTVKIFEGWRG